MAVKVRKDLFVFFALDDQHSGAVSAMVYRGITKEIIDKCRDDEQGEFSSEHFFEEVIKRLVAPPMMYHSGTSFTEVFSKVAGALAAISLGSEVPTEFEDVRLVRFAFHQVRLKKDVLKRDFPMAYYNLVDAAVERQQRKVRQKEVALALTRAAATGYFGDIGAGGVNIQLWIKPMIFWYVDDTKPFEWTPEDDFEGGPGEGTLEGPPV